MGLEFPTLVRRGEEVRGAFYFIPHRALPSGCRLLVRLEKNGKKYLLKEMEPPFPAARWPVGKLAKVGPFPVLIPPDLPAGEYGLEVILSFAAGKGEKFEPYENPEISGFTVSKILVTDSPGR
jgi:hypothetical protein